MTVFFFMPSLGTTSKSCLSLFFLFLQHQNRKVLLHENTLRLGSEDSRDGEQQTRENGRCVTELAGAVLKESLSVLILYSAVHVAEVCVFRPRDKARTKNAEQHRQRIQKKELGRKESKWTRKYVLVLYVIHTFIALSLLSELGEVDVVFARQGGGHCFL